MKLESGLIGRHIMLKSFGLLLIVNILPVWPIRDQDRDGSIRLGPVDVAADHATGFQGDCNILFKNIGEVGTVDSMEVL